MFKICEYQGLGPKKKNVKKKNCENCTQSWPSVKQLKPFMRQWTTYPSEILKAFTHTSSGKNLKSRKGITSWLNTGKNSYDPRT